MLRTYPVGKFSEGAGLQGWTSRLTGTATLYTYLFGEKFYGEKTPEASNSNSHSHACGNGIMNCSNTGGVEEKS